MFFFLASLSYDGSSFYGWAKQPKKNTAQQHLEDAFSGIFKQKISIKGVSRLDKGAHAKDQYFFFSLNNFVSASKLLLILNRALKGSFFIKKIKEIDVNFISSFSAQREYRYFINTGKFNVWKNKYRWELNKPLLKEQLTQALNIFHGEHDFFNFCHCSWKDKKKKKTKRTIQEIKVLKKGCLIMISIKANGFLRYQVRAIIGEAVNCCLGKQSLDDLRRKLDYITYPATNKYRFLAPASGLYLWKVFWIKKEKN